MKCWPAAEDQPAALPPAEAAALFGRLPCHLFQARVGDRQGALPTAVWRLLLYLMLAAMLAESLLTLPGRLRVKEVADVVG